MRHKIIKVFQYLLLSFFFISCDVGSRFPAGERKGYRPIYASADPIEIVASQAIETPGKICHFKNYLLIGEHKAGVHVFDNSDPVHPINISFIKIAGNVNMVVDNNTLIVDYHNQLVCLDLSDIGKLKETSRVKAWPVLVPPGSGNYYECPDPSRNVVGWEEATLQDPKCYR